MAYMGGLHSGGQKISGRLHPEIWGRISATIIFLGFNLTSSQSSRATRACRGAYHAYAPEFQVYNVLSSAGASILAVGYLMPLIYFFWSLRYGVRASGQPVGATGLEWKTALASTDGELRAAARRARGGVSLLRTEEAPIA